MKQLLRAAAFLISCNLLICFVATPVAAQQALTTTKTLPAVGTDTIIGTVDGIAITVKAQSPAAEATPLQVACVFEYTEGDIFNPPALPAAANGMFHLDSALGGLITTLRKSGQFMGHRFETLLLTPPRGTMPARKLLLIGLGDRNQFTPDIMTTVGSIGMREALRLGVASYAHASDLKDGGVDSPTAAVAANVVKGALAAYRTQVYLQGKKMDSFRPVVKITLLAGPAFYAVSCEGIKETLTTAGH